VSAQPLPTTGQWWFPVSYAQQRLWFLDQLAPGNSFYNMCGTVRLQGGLDASLLERALNEVMRRHEILRTRFDLLEGEPVQIVDPSLLIGLKRVDLTSLPAAGRLQAAVEIANNEVRQPFDLRRGPLLRASLIDLDRVDQVFVLVMHHIVGDAWSTGVLFGELDALLTAYRQGRSSPLPELGIQYADYAVWQREWLQGEVLERELGYWRQRLADLPVLMLPTSRPRPSVASYAGGYELIRLPVTLSRKLKELSQRESVTLFMTLVGAFQLLLHRYTGQPEVVIGTPIAGRSRAELEPLIGCFVNSLVLRLDLSGAPDFRELLRRVREMTVGAYSHAELPFERLVEEQQPERDLSRNPLFQVMFQLLQSGPGGGRGTTAGGEGSLALQRGTTALDLTCNLWEEGEQIVGTLDYSSELFDAAMVARLVRHYETLLESIVAHPAERVWQLQLLTDAERQKLVGEWNATSQPIPELCVHQLVEQQAEWQPAAVAVEYEGGSLCYGELNARANRLARYLRQRGVGRGTLVGLFVERSLEMMVALVGILKAGAAYVPLDPSYPDERIAFLLEDSQAPLVVTQSHLASHLAGGASQPIYLDQQETEIQAQPDGNLEPWAEPSSLAYVLYTSGSTGKPKGVQIEHRAVVNLLASMQLEPGFSSQDRMLAVTTLCFDIAGLELFLPLLTGGTVIVASRATASDPHRLIQELACSRATVMQATPASWRMLVEAGWSGQPGLRIWCGGEALSRRLANDLLARGTEVWNLYGPTETTIWSAVHRVDKGSDAIPLGHPIANTSLYVLDPCLQPVPVGVPGELCIGGAGVARGYWGRDELTSQRFVANPFAEDWTGRIYRTGDAVRFGETGAIEFLGRADHQVKIRGFRVELGEVESALRQCDGITEAVALVRQDQTGDSRLIAYVQALDAPSLQIEPLRTELKKRLPDYMIPSNFVVISSFPLTANGKINRTALDTGIEMNTPGRHERLLPRSPLENTIGSIFAEVLGIQEIGVHDDFFNLGGNSLLVVKAISRLSGAFELNLPVQLFFELRTVAKLAMHIESTLIEEIEALPEEGVESILRVL
jgi:amino acid adenylation domain-containing protein